MSLFNHLSVKWKIYLIAIISIIGFGGYLGFNVWVNSNNATLLASLRSVSFPVLEKANANRVRLDRLGELLNSAVLTGEEEFINTADTSAKQMDAVFGEILVLVPDKKSQVQDISVSFNEYFSLAKEIASRMAKGTSNMADGEMDSVLANVEKKEAALKKLTSQLDAFIKDSRENFSGNINTANSNSKTLLTSGFVIWIINILILTVTVYMIARIILSNINDVSHSLHEIAHGGGDFSKKIPVSSRDEIGLLATSFNELMDNLREKTNDLISMMENMHQGLFTITEKETIHQEYSAYIEQIFNTKAVAGRNYADLLFNGAELGSNALDQIKVAVSSLLGSDEMMFEFNKHLLVKEYSLIVQNGGEPVTKILELDWDPILSDGEIKKIMVTVRDVTELKIMQAAAEEQKKELQIIGQILKASPEKFDRFYDNALKLLEKNEAIIAQNINKNIKAVADLFVNMHTIKGNARTFNFSFITDPVHEAENIYDRLRKEEDYPWDAAKLQDDIAKVREAISQYHNVKAGKLTFTEKAGVGSRDKVLVPRDSYQKLLSSFDELLASGAPDIQQIDSLYHFTKSLDAIPFNIVVDELVESLPSLANQLEKVPPLLELKTQQLAIRTEFADVVNDVFTHLLRNSLDHGIETSQERVAKNKKEQGVILVQVEFSEASATMLLSDDGKGLALGRIKDKALASGQITEADAANPQKIAECLFLSGVSTAEKITAISGRGVGMDAVRQYLQQNGCNIELILDAKVAASDEFAPFTLKITLARHIYEVIN